MRSTHRILALALIVPFIIPLAGYAAEEPVDLEMVNRIRNEGFHHSKVMATLQHLTDEIGPRLTGSPAMKEANDWTVEQLKEWEIDTAHLEPWGPFGRGWSFSRASVHLIQPREMPLLALPRAWSPGTEGPVRGLAMRVKYETKEDLEEFRGTLAGKILFLSDAREIEPAKNSPFERYSPDELDELTQFEVPSRSTWRAKARKRWELREAFTDLVMEEEALATISISSRDRGLLRLSSGGSREIDGKIGVPALAMAAEQYNWILRMLEDDKEVELEIDVTAQFHTEDLMAYNTIAEIPGTSEAGEVVMAGGHLDSWHAGTGSNDNAAGTAVVMEAIRILKVLDVKPRRTIRIGLWAAEEQGLLGSKAYVDEHFASRPESTDPEELKLPSYLREEQWPINLKPEHAKLSAYFNMDNGSGKFRGIYTQQNAAVLPIFTAWLAPFNDLGADTVTNRNTSGTDHLRFDRVGLPGFQFIQDKLDYFTVTHHTNMDVSDHAQEEDLKQASIILASFLYHAAMRDEMLPRMPMPREMPKEEKPEEEKPEAVEEPVEAEDSEKPAEAEAPVVPGEAAVAEGVEAPAEPATPEEPEQIEESEIPAEGAIPVVPEEAAVAEAVEEAAEAAMIAEPEAVTEPEPTPQ